MEQEGVAYVVVVAVDVGKWNKVAVVVAIVVVVAVVLVGGNA